MDIVTLVHKLGPKKERRKKEEEEKSLVECSVYSWIGRAPLQNYALYVHEKLLGTNRLLLRLRHC